MTAPPNKRAKTIETAEDRPKGDCLLPPTPGNRGQYVYLGGTPYNYPRDLEEAQWFVFPQTLEPPSIQAKVPWRTSEVQCLNPERMRYTVNAWDRQPGPQMFPRSPENLHQDMTIVRNSGSAVKEALLQRQVVTKYQKLYALAVYAEMHEGITTESEMDAMKPIQDARDELVQQLDREYEQRQEAIKAITKAQDELREAEADLTAAMPRPNPRGPTVRRTRRRI